MNHFLFLCLCLWISILFIIETFCQTDGIPLRFMAANVGNAQIGPYSCWEDKLCNPDVANNIKNYISTYKPDVVILVEVMGNDQLFGTLGGGPVVPNDYQGFCGKSINRFTGDVEEYNTSDSSHQHECIVWNPARLSLIENSPKSVYGRNDDYGKKYCNYDFTAFKVSLTLENQYNITFIGVHPDSQYEECRRSEIQEYWNDLANDTNVIIGGDWNCGKSCYLYEYCRDSSQDIQKPENFRVIYSNGQHWNLYNDTKEQPTAVYLDGAMGEWIDHDYTNFGDPCTDCGSFYGTESLPYSSAVGGYDGMPRADGGYGCDHRQLICGSTTTTRNGNIHYTGDLLFMQDNYLKIH